MLADFFIVPDDGYDSRVDFNPASDVGDHLFDGFAFTRCSSFDGTFSSLSDGGLGLPTFNGRHGSGQDCAWFHGFAFVDQYEAIFWRQVVFSEFFAADYTEATAFFVGFQLNHAVDVSQYRCAFGNASLEELFHSG